MQNTKYYLTLFFIMIFWGMNVPLVKILVGNLSPITMTAFRVMTAGLTVFMILAIFKLVRLPTKREAKYILLATVLNVVCHHYFLSLGLKGTSGTNAGIILGAGPILTALIATVLIKKKTNFLRWTGFILGGAGVAVTTLVGSNGISEVNIGDIYVFLSILTQAFSFILISKLAKTLDPRLLTGYMLVIGAGILLVIGLITEPGAIKEFATLSKEIWLAFFTSAIIATAFGHMSYNFIIGKIGPAEASIFLNFTPFFALVGSVIMLGEKVTIFHLIGLVLIVGGVLLGSGVLERGEKMEGSTVAPLQGLEK
ncbi:EamA family transporter [Sutcliffiella horikoshii]|uniref:EamA family transporter n=1 Tax=Sutcliffiella horikoshii TaxID=79883 RepID=A0ABN4ZIA8_9BACI|nr:DMT family transporter [Sutcliffiella horikoshii]ART78140.1 EamA family transporter [Sutcliffiella horikoshii]